MTAIATIDDDKRVHRIVFRNGPLNPEMLVDPENRSVVAALLASTSVIESRQNGTQGGSLEGRFILKPGVCQRHGTLQAAPHHTAFMQARRIERRPVLRPFRSHRTGSTARPSMRAGRKS